MSNNATTKDNLEIYFHLKSLILSNAKVLYGGSNNGRPRTYDVITSSRVRSQTQYRVSLIGFDENHKAQGKVDVDNKVLSRSGVKLSLNLAMEDLLKKTREELWKD